MSLYSNTDLNDTEIKSASKSYLKYKRTRKKSDSRVEDESSSENENKPSKLFSHNKTGTHNSNNRVKFKKKSGLDESGVGDFNNESNNFQLRTYDHFVKQVNSTEPILQLHSSTRNDNNLNAVKVSSSQVDPSQLVLIKYKKNVDDSGNNSLRANQLQKKREIHSLLIFIFFLFITIITLSQILVMHSQTNKSNFYQIRLMQEELKLMDQSIDRMLKEKNVLPMQVW